MNESIITLAEAFEAINGYPGLVFGPMATIYPNSYSLIIEGAVREVGGAAGINESNIGPELDLLRMNNPVKAKELEEKIFHGLAIVGGLNDIPSLVRAKWSMCVSLTQDMVFESAMQNHQDSLPTSRTVTVIDHPTVRSQSRTIPIYKLLGSYLNREDGHTLAISESDVLMKKAAWKNMLSNCADFFARRAFDFFWYRYRCRLSEGFAW